MKELNIKDSEFGYVHAVSGPGMIFLQTFRGFLLCRPGMEGCLVTI